MKRKISGICAAAALAISFAACNSSDTATNDNKDSLNSGQNTSSTDMSSNSSNLGKFAALADSVRINTEQGNYLNPRTGKPYTKLTVDATTGRITDEGGAPVWRYVDRRNWWVYGDDDWDANWQQQGEAKMEGEKLTYKADNDKWVDYDTKWKVSDDGMKQKMVTQDGDKIKMKTDEEGNTKIKIGDEKMKIDSNGNMKKN